MTATPGDGASTVEINGTRLEILASGKGRPLLFLHPGHPSGALDADAPILRQLGGKFRVIAPVHPGFGEEPAARTMTSIDDLAYLYLDLLDALDLRDVVLVGASMGGWIAAEMAVKSTARLSRLVLVDTVGIKIGDRETRDIADIFSLVPGRLNEIVYADPAIAKFDPATLPEGKALAMARSREHTARYTWSPYMHNPKLKGRLHRVRVPTLFLWGTADRVTATGYGRAFADAVPGAKFETIDGAGHFPHLERPQQVAERIAAFVGGTPAS